MVVHLSPRILTPLLLALTGIVLVGASACGRAIGAGSNESPSSAVAQALALDKQAHPSSEIAYFALG